MSAANLTASKIQIFISYSHEDKNEKEKLLSHLKNLEKILNVDVWHDGLIPAGGSIEPTIMSKLATSDIILLLISPNYINSNFCSNIEMVKAFDRHRAKECIIVPIILKKIVTLEGFPFSELKCLPTDAKPISQYRPRENGYVEVAKSLLALLKSSGATYCKNEEHSSASNNVSSPTKRKRKVRQVSKPEDSQANSNDMPFIELYAQGRLTKVDVSQDFVNLFREYPKKYVDFCERAITLTRRHFEKFRSAYRASPTKMTDAKRMQNLRTFLFELCSYMTQYLLGDVGVRVHFRGLSGENYIGLAVHTGSLKAKKADLRKWAKDLTAIPINQGMIYHSNRLRAPLIKSLNEKYHKSGRHDDVWVEYLTCALTELDSSINALLSMGVSISSEVINEKYPLLQIMAYTRFDKQVCQLLINYTQSCQRIDKGFNIKSMLDTIGN